MNNGDPNVITVELVAEALEELLPELVLVGGCAVGLLITDKARPPVRATIDVDMVVELASLGEYYALGPRLRACGFYEQPNAEYMGRWAKGPLIVDVMPTREDILGHSVNTWYAPAVKDADKVSLPSGRIIQVASAPMFIATKLEAFNGRGNSDYLASHDLEDIINVVDGREELVREVLSSSQDVQEFINEEFMALIVSPNFIDSIPGHLHGDEASQARLPILMDRLRTLAGL